MKDRIKRIIESQHMTQQEFAENIKVAPATLSSIFTGRTAPSLKIVDAIKSRFPDISTDWLLFGRGAMTDYRNSEAGASFNSPTPTPPIIRQTLTLHLKPLLTLALTTQSIQTMAAIQQQRHPILKHLKLYSQKVQAKRREYSW